MKHALIGLLVLFLSAEAFAKSKYYRFDDLQWSFIQVPVKEMKMSGVYLCEEDNGDGTETHYWVTRDHDDPIVPGSILLGHRFGISKGRAIHFELNSKLDWVAVNPTRKPVVWRQHKKMGNYVAEEPMDDWWTGHHVSDDERTLKVPMYRGNPKPKPTPTPAPEPVQAKPLVPVTPVKPKSPVLPPTAVPTPSPTTPKPQPKVEETVPVPTAPVEPPKPFTPVNPTPPEATRPPASEPKPISVDNKIGCEIELSATVVQVGEQVRMSMTTVGQVDAAMLDNAAVDIPFVIRLADTSKPGRFRIKGMVHGPNGDNSCEALLEVRAK